MAALFAVKARAAGLFNSFKPKAPEDVRYHRTFDLPTRTTLLGFAAAALGLNERELYIKWNGGPSLAETIEVTSILEGIAGHIRDYWTIKKIVERSVKGKKKPPFSAMQVREQLFKPCYLLCFASSDDNTVGKLCDALKDPRYPLSLGRDDELVRVTEIEQCSLRKLIPPFTLSNTLLLMNFLRAVEEEDRKCLLQSLIRLKSARRFSIREDGARVGEDMEEYVQLTKQIRVVGDIGAYTDAPEGKEGNNFVFL
jgi:CRISPR-associated Cas5-like protein